MKTLRIAVIASLFAVEGSVQALGVPFLAAVALTRPRTKTYFAEAAAAAEGAEEEP